MILDAGIYLATAGGNKSIVTIEHQIVIFVFHKFVKGFNIPDQITVYHDGVVKSDVLGYGGELQH